LTAGIDVQRDRIECTIYGWGKDRECWGIEHRVLIGAPDMPEAWAQLDALLTTPRQLDNGTVLPISCALVDSGDGAYSENVYRYTKAREKTGVFSIKGRGGQNVPLINQPTRGNSQGAILFSLGVDAGKSLVMGRLRIEDEGPGYVHYPRQADRGFGEIFFQQLTAEVYEQKFERGKMVTGWKKIRERNEALDCFVYATAAIEIVNPNFEALAEYYNSGGAKVSAQPKKKRGVMSKGVSL
jgi:phage terminase large subunit GpA-like protein